MHDYAVALALATLPALGNFAGGLVAEAFDVSRRTLSLALHAAVGVLLAVVGLELMPEALDVDAPWIPVGAFLVGGVFFLAADRAIHFVEARFEADEAAAAPWLVFFGVSLDLFSDGVMIGAGATISSALGLLLALAQVSADIPEGFATIAGFKRQGVDRRRRLAISGAFALPIFAGATIGFWAARGGPELLKVSLLAFTAGVLIAVVVEEIAPQAHRGTESQLAALVLVGGFALFALVSAYVG